MTLFEVLSKDERIIVYSSKEEDTIYTWNQSLTLQVWRRSETQVAGFPDLRKDDWEELSIRTLSKEPSGYFAARKAAIAWSVDGWNDDR